MGKLKKKSESFLPPKNLTYRIREIGEIIRAKATYLFFPLFKKNEKNELYRFLGKHGMRPYPGDYSLKYKEKVFDCFLIGQTGLRYVMHHSKKLFFPKSYTDKAVKKSYRNLLIEQDPDSPHRYIEDYSSLKGKTLLDIGAAEGIFTLDVIDIIEHAFLFECEQIWIEALNATFAPWKDKVTIVPLYVANKNTEKEVTLDKFISSRDLKNLYIKMDIEGAELTALEGAKETLGREDITLSVCTYHRTFDAEEINSFLTSQGYKTSFSKGFLYFRKQLNKAVIRAHK